MVKLGVWVHQMVTHLGGATHWGTTATQANLTALYGFPFGWLRWVSPGDQPGAAVPTCRVGSSDS